MKHSIPRIFRSFLLGLVALLPSAGDAATFSEEVARLATPLVDATGGDPTRAVGLVVTVVTPHGVRSYGFGAIRAGVATVPDGDTCFQIASVSKAMTGLLLASMIEDATAGIAPSDPANAHLPAGVQLPSFSGQPITVEHLARHHGSLPDLPNNMTGPPTSPAQNYSTAQLASYLSMLTLPAAPGTNYSYSNLGSGVLGMALVERAGAGTYSALLQSRLAGPLGMTSTGLNEPAFVAQIAPRLAQGYRVSGGALVTVGLSDMGVLEGGGEVISTGNDMGRLLSAFAGITALPVPGAVARAIAPATPGPGGAATGYGLDILSPSSGVIQYEKAGVVAGYTTFMAFRSHPASGVVVLSNRGQHQAILPLTRQLLALLTPPELAVALTAPDTVQVTFSAAARLTYEVQTSADLVTWSTATTVTNSTDAIAQLSASLTLSPPRQFVRLRY